MERRTEAPERRAVAAQPDLGLVELASLDRHWPVARFTATGYAALRHLVPDRRALNARDHAQMIEELAALDHVAKPDAA